MHIPQSLRAAALLCAGVLIFSLQDLVIKSISGDYPVHQAMMIRSLTALPILGFMVHRTGGLKLLFSGRLHWLVLRGVVLTLSYTSYYLAIPAMKLANAVALSFTAPLFITLLAIGFLGERPRVDRWAAVALGGVGAMVMLRPDATGFDAASLLPLLAAMTYGIAQIMARRLGEHEPAPVMAFYQNIMFLIIASLLAGVLHEGVEGVTHPSLQFLSRSWAMPSVTDLLMMMACGPIAAIATVLLTQAYRMAEASFVTPYEYTSLVWGSLWGFAFWGEVPGTATFLGAACIVAAGLHMLWADGRHRRAALARPPGR